MSAVSTPHPFLPNVTAESIISAALYLAGDGPLSAVTIEDAVLESGASTSSVYHYFGNRQGLVAAAEQERYRRLAMTEDRRRLEGGTSAQTADEFLAFIADQLVRIVTDADALDVRRQRLRVAAAALDDPVVFDRMAAIQTTMFRVIGDVVAAGQHRGLVNPDIDPIAYCAWFHGMALGRTFTERTYGDVDAWLAVAIPAALAPLRLPEASTQTRARR